MEFTQERSNDIKNQIYTSMPKEHHSSLDRLYSSVDYDNYSPVRRLESNLGISGIYKNYNIPQNMEPLEFEALMKPMRVFEVIERGFADGNQEMLAYLNQSKPKALFEVKNMYNALIELNPELKAAEVNPAKIKSYIAVISGACSGFPAEDIVEFSKSNEGIANAAINHRKCEQSNKIEELTGKKNIVANWCPSENTFNKIVAKVKAKNAQPKTPIPVFENTGYYQFLASRGHYD